MEVGIFLWLGLAFVVGVAANTRNRDGIGWFLLAVIVSPLIAGLLLLAVPRRESRSRKGLIDIFSRRDEHPDGPVRITPGEDKSRWRK